MKCPNCGSQVDEYDEVCAQCGNTIESLDNNSDSATIYSCNECGEELEFITAYKQWYCYNCQTYFDFPEQKEMSKEELKSGKKWFKIIIPVGLIGGTVGFFTQNDILMFSLFLKYN